MQVFATEFPVSANRTLDEFIAVAKEWLCGSPHYPWDNPAELAECRDEIVTFTRDDQRVEIGLVDTQSGAVCGMRHTATERDTLEWTSELVGSQHHDGLWVSVTVYCTSLVKGARPPSSKKPYFVKLALDRLGGGTDAVLEVRKTPYMLSASDVATATKIVRGSTGCQLPVVYVSCGFDGRPAVDFVEMARSLAGVAHVVIEPSRRFSVELAQQTNSMNVYGGAVAIYWPNGTGIVRFLPRDYVSRTELLADVEATLREGWLFAKPQRASSWFGLSAAISRRQIDALRASGSHELDDYVKRFDAENAALSAQLEEAKAINARLQASSQHTARARRPHVGELLQTGKEQELYEGELLDCVLAALRCLSDRTAAGSRRATILDDLLAANPEVGRGREIETTVRETLDDAMKIGPREIAALEQVGFVVESGGKHYRATFGGDARLMFTLHKTASDNRAPKNLVSTIVGKLFR